MRFGITVTKRIGNAVIRNRMKRRFRELARSVLPESGLLHHDHVLIGRAGGVERDFALMRSELVAGLQKLRRGGGKADRAGRGARRPGGRGRSASGSSRRSRNGGS